MNRFSVLFSVKGNFLNCCPWSLHIPCRCGNEIYKKKKKSKSIPLIEIDCPIREYRQTGPLDWGTTALINVWYTHIQEYGNTSRFSHHILERGPKTEQATSHISKYRSFYIIIVVLGLMKDSIRSKPLSFN